MVPDAAGAEKMLSLWGKIRWCIGRERLPRTCLLARRLGMSTGSLNLSSPLPVNDKAASVGSIYQVSDGGFRSPHGAGDC